MKDKNSELWFCSSGTPFPGTDPYFYKPEEFSWTRDIEEQWEVILDELQNHLDSDNTKLIPYVNKEMTSKPGHWKTMGLMFWAKKDKSNCLLFPQSMKILEKIPNLTAISFNSLEPETSIKPHVGDTNAIIRCHLGLIVPDSAPRCGFRVGDETHSWENGKFLMFSDAYLHTAWNNTKCKRYILVLDILKDEYVDQLGSISRKVLTNIYTEALYQRFGMLQHYFSGKWGRSTITAFMSLFFLLAP